VSVPYPAPRLRDGFVAVDGDGPDLVRDLLRPAAYGEGRDAAVSLRTTHASWVFLTGGNVWKVMICAVSARDR
jgi:hypothetical protein